eukprot:1142689-Pelagomonas_calceolata.AAC.2
MLSFPLNACFLACSLSTASCSGNKGSVGPCRHVIATATQSGACAVALNVRMCTVPDGFAYVPPGAEAHAVATHAEMRGVRACAYCAHT